MVGIHPTGKVVSSFPGGDRKYERSKTAPGLSSTITLKYELWTPRRQGVPTLPFDLSTVLDDYHEGDVTIATACSHTSLQIFEGARREGLNTLGLAVGEEPKHYDAFPRAKPDEFLVADTWPELADFTDELVERNAIIVPHGSFVEYMGADRYAEMEVPMFGNRYVLDWESDRNKERQWLQEAGLRTPPVLDDPRDIVQPVMVKYHGAKGGSGFFIANSYPEFLQKIDDDVDEEEVHIQEFTLGTRYYMHYFYSPLSQDGYTVRDGNLQMLSVDRRDETTIDEAHRLGSIRELENMGVRPSFVVTGNMPMVLRESLLPKVFEMGQATIDYAYENFGGLWGPFCLETVVTDDLEFTVFEISARIVAGTNPFITSNPYGDLVEPGLSTGQRIAQEIKTAQKQHRLDEILT